MTKRMLAVAMLSVVALPSCMHPVDRVLQARAETKTEQLAAKGRVSQGACDDVGQYAAKFAGQGLTVEIAAVASTHP